jgi:ParB-like chromosome segregation protein Spo0J
MNKLPLHPLCEMFPRMAGAEFDALKDDIKTNGLRHPIITHKGMILDGGNRYQACLDMGVKPLMTEYSGENLVTYVLSANFFRRHLSPGQQAAIVASAQDWVKAQKQGGTKGNQYTKLETGNVTGFQTVADRAAVSGVSDKTQRMADQVFKADPDLAAKVAHGEISLPKAVERVKPKKDKPTTFRPSAPVDEPDDTGPEAGEIEANEIAARADAAAIEKLLDADDKLATAVAEIKRLNAEVAVLKVSRNGYQNQCNDLIRRVKSQQRRLDEIRP